MNKLKKEYLFFKQQEPNMRTLLVTNMLYALVLPIVEIFVGAYIMRNTSDPVMVAFYQLAMYIGIITTSLVNGYLLKKYSVKTLYSIGILVSGISMFGMMTIKSLGFVELGLAGFLITSIGVPLIIGAFISQIDGKEVFGFLFNINTSYCVVTMAAVVITVIACMTLWKGKFENPKETNFLYFRFNILWKKMLWLAGLKGMVQGFLVTAPAILVLKLVGDEGALGLIQGVSGALTAVLVYVLGRMARPQDRLKIFVGGLIVFFAGTLFNGILFSKIENRNEYAYILSHEFGLFLGRAFGLLLFIFLAYCVSQDFALKYALVIVAGLQLAAYPLAKNITNQTDTIEHENDK